MVYSDHDSCIFLVTNTHQFSTRWHTKNSIEDEDLSVQIVDGILIAPLLETALYQMFIFWILKLIRYGKIQ